MTQQLTFVSALALALAVSGCATQPGQQNPGNMSNTGMGAIIGALGGAAAGAAIGHNNRGQGALIGAAGGALIGTGVGYYMDKQKAKLEADLAREVQSGSIEIKQNADQSLSVTMNEGQTFDTNSSVVKTAFYPTMDKIASTLQQYPKTTLTITGHTDSQGSDSYNQQLSQRRASSVKSYFVRKGVSSSRLTAIGAGKTQPRADNATAAGRAMNRRVEIQIVPMADAR